MRPRISDKEKRKIVVKLLMSSDEKQKLEFLVKREKYGCMSDYMRNKLFDQSKRKVVSLDDQAKEKLSSLDYELNKIGVNLNQLSKRMNSFTGYNVGDNDRQLLKQAFEMMRNCLITLQNLLH